MAECSLSTGKNAGIEGIVLARSDYENVDAYSEALENLLKEKHTDLIVLAISGTGCSSFVSVPRSIIRISFVTSTSNAGIMC